MIFRKFLSQRTVMPYSATPPNPAITRSSSRSYRLATSRIGANGTRSPSARRRRSPAAAARSSARRSPATKWPSFIRWCARVNPAGPRPDHQHLVAGSPASAAAGAGRAGSSASAGRRSRSPRAAPARPSACGSRPAGCRPAPAADRCRPSCSRCRCGARSRRRADCRPRRSPARRCCCRAPSTRFISEIFSSSGQPASVTPKTLFLKPPSFSCRPLRQLSFPWLWHQMQ